MVAVLHMICIAPASPPYGKYIIVGLIAWIAILSYIQDGLNQLREEQKRLSQTT